jgi:hypothetical protein
MDWMPGNTSLNTLPSVEPIQVIFLPDFLMLYLQGPRDREQSGGTLIGRRKVKV